MDYFSEESNLHVAKRNWTNDQDDRLLSFLITMDWISFAQELHEDPLMFIGRSSDEIQKRYHMLCRDRGEECFSRVWSTDKIAILEQGILIVMKVSWII